MRREDVELVKLSAALAAEQDPAKQAEIKKAMKVREGKILPIFQQIAVQLYLNLAEPFLAFAFFVMR